MFGFVQFDPESTDPDKPNPKPVNGQDVYEFVIKGGGFQGQPLVKISLWPQFAEVHGKVKKGDFVAVDGKYDSYTGQSRTFHSINAKRLFINGQLIEPSETGGPRVANATAASGGDALPF